MPYTCQTCGRNWDDVAADENDFLCTRKCGGKLEYGSHPDDFSFASWPLQVEEAYPFPIACAFRRLREDFEAHSEDRDALRQLIRLKDLVETTVKFLALISLAARLDRKDTIDELDKRILQSLVAPSLGTWSQAILQPLVKSPGMRSDSRMGPLVEFADKSFFAELQEFTAFRNRILGHGVVRHAKEDRSDLLDWLPKILKMLERAQFLGRQWKLVQACSSLDEQSWRSWSGADSEKNLAPVSLPEPPPVNQRPGEFFLVEAGGSLISLYPFIYLLICPRCEGSERLFVYDGQSRYTTSRKEVSLIENHGGHKEIFPNVGEALAEQFSETLLLDYYRKHRRNFEVLEGKLVEFDFDSYRQRIRHFVGRKPVLERIERFLSGESVPQTDGSEKEYDRGYFLLIAEAGIGKTALLTHWIDHNESCPLPIRFFWRRGRNLTPFDFVRHLYHGLLTKHNIEDSEPPKDENEYRRKLDSLLHTVSERYLADGEKEVIVIDGLDEAGGQQERIEAIRAIPQLLPPNVYFLLSSRPIRETDSQLGEFCYSWKLNSADNWNRADVREYIEHQLATQFESGDLGHDQLPQIEEAAEGNFLWAEYFCQGILTGTLPLEKLRGGLPRLAGLDGLYREFWNRVTENLDAETEQKIWRVAGTLLVAKSALTAEQICRFANLNDDEFIVIRRILQQYLDEIELPNELDPECPLIGFRIYHASFRDYLARQPDVVLRHHHNRIVEYFQDVRLDDFDSWDRYGLSFVPFHALETERSQEILIGNESNPGLLCDLNFIEAKCRAGLSNQLSIDYHDAQLVLAQFQREVRERKKRQSRCLEYATELTSFAKSWRNGESMAHPIPPSAIDRRLVLESSNNESGTERLLRFKAFYSENRKTLADHPEWLASVAANHADSGPVALQAETRLLEAKIQHFHRNFRPPPKPLFPACEGILDSPSSEIHTLAANSMFTRAISGGKSGGINIWDLEIASCLAMLEGHTDTVEALCVDASFSSAISGSRDRTLRTWDLNSQASKSILIGHTGWIYSIAASADFSLAISGSGDRTVRLWDLENEACLHTFEGHRESVTAVAADPSFNRALTGGGDGVLRVWNLKARELEGEIEGVDCWINAIAVNHDFSEAVTVGDDGNIRFWDLENRNCSASIPAHESAIRTISVSADFTRAITGGHNHKLCLWDLKSLSRIATFEGHQECISTSSVRADFATAITGSHDRTLRIWDLEKGESIPTTRASQGAIQAISGSKELKKAVFGGDDTDLHVWDIEKGVEVSKLRGHQRTIFSVATNHDASRAISGSYDRTIRLWDVDSDECVAVLEGHKGRVRTLAANAEFTRAVSGSLDRTIRLWDLQNHCFLKKLVGHTGWVTDVKVDPTFNFVLSGSGDQSLKLWSIEDGQCIRTLAGHTDMVTTLALSADTEFALSAGADKSLRVWNLSSGNCEADYPTGDYVVRALATNNDGTRAILCSDDQTVQFWDLATGVCLATYFTNSTVRSVVADFESGRVICGSDDGELHILSTKFDLKEPTNLNA